MSETLRSEQLEKEPKVEIQEYSDKHREQIKDLIHNVYETERGWQSTSGRPDLDIIPEMYMKNGGNFWVAIDEGKVIGTIGLIDQGKQRATMHRFAVLKNFRGKEKGVSSELFTTLIRFAEEHDFQKIFLGTTPDAEAAIKFYKRNGFMEVKSLPEDLSKKSYLINDTLFYELDLKKEK